MRVGSVVCTSILIGMLAGCGGPDYPSGSLEGTITVDNEPLPHGQISFTPMESGQGPPVYAEISAGKYIHENVPIGKVRVVFHAQKETGRMLHDPETRRDYAEMVSLVPMQYQSTGIEIDVKPGKETKDFALTSK